MGINWKELSLILFELKLENSYIQKITEHTFNSFTLHLFNKNEKAFFIYFEIGTAYSRVNKTEILRKKSNKNQRFTQYLKANLIGRKITKIYQWPFDRAFTLTLENNQDLILMHIRLFSGPKANIIVTDIDNRILELLYRRPKQNEEKGEILNITFKENEGEKEFNVRKYPENESFNVFLDKEEENKKRNEEKRKLTEKALEEKEEKKRFLLEEKRKLDEKIQSNKDYEEIKTLADTLSSSIHLIRKGDKQAKLNSLEQNGTIILTLDPWLSPTENLEKLYQKYHKKKKTYFLALDEKEKIEKELNSFIEEASSSNIFSLSTVKKNETSLKIQNREKYPGIYLKSRNFYISVGRSSDENDLLLRSSRGEDTWLHTRDYSGGYVIIHSKKGETIPLPVLLDAANLAIFFSKGRKNGKADLYYTKIKYLKRIKGEKKGLVLPTQEKNLTVRLDENRVKQLLKEKEEI